MSHWYFKMNHLTALVFILLLGPLNCERFEFGSSSPEIREHCRKQEGVGEYLSDLEDMSIVAYYLCVYEKQGIIVNGLYVGNFSLCEGVKDANKLELARKVVRCSMPIQ